MSIGSRTPEESTARTRPKPRSRMPGSSRVARSIGVTASSWSAARSPSASPRRPRATGGAARVQHAARRTCRSRPARRPRPSRPRPGRPRRRRRCAPDRVPARRARPTAASSRSSSRDQSSRSVPRLGERRGRMAAPSPELAPPTTRDAVHAAALTRGGRRRRARSGTAPDRRGSSTSSSSASGDRVEPGVRAPARGCAPETRAPRRRSTSLRMASPTPGWPSKAISGRKASNTRGRRAGRRPPARAGRRAAPRGRRSRSSCPPRRGAARRRPRPRRGRRRRSARARWPAARVIFGGVGASSSLTATAPLRVQASSSADTGSVTPVAAGSSCSEHRQRAAGRRRRAKKARPVGVPDQGGRRDHGGDGAVLAGAARPGRRRGRAEARGAPDGERDDAGRRRRRRRQHRRRARRRSSDGDLAHHAQHRDAVDAPAGRGAHRVLQARPSTAPSAVNGVGAIHQVPPVSVWGSWRRPASRSVDHVSSRFVGVVACCAAVPRPGSGAGCRRTVR